MNKTDSAEILQKYVFDDEECIAQDMKDYNKALKMAIEVLQEDISEDGTLTITVRDGSKVNRVLVCGDNHLGGLYYPDEDVETLQAEAKETVLNKMLEEEMIVLPQDYVKVVRCKDCRHRVYDEERNFYYCETYYGQGDVSDENFCQWGERSK